MKTFKHICILLIATFIASCGSDFDSAGFANNPGGGTGQGGSLARFAIVNNTLYAVNGRDLKVFSLQDPTRPSLVSTQNLGTIPETVFPRDNQTLFLGTTTGMMIYDCSTPNSPVLLDVYSHVTACDPVVANDDFAYVTLRSENTSTFCDRGVNELHVLDVTNMRSIRQLNTVPMTKPVGLGLYGDTLLVCDDGVRIFDITNGANPVSLRYIPSIKAIDLIPRGNLMIFRLKNTIEQYRYKNGQLTHLSTI